MIERLKPNQQWEFNGFSINNHQSSIVNHKSSIHIRSMDMLKVLLVEDNRIYREAFKDNLLRHFPAMSIVEAENADQAVQKIKATPPDLIFMDIRLPGMNGLQLTQRIKKDFPKIPIAILTGYDLPEYRQAAVQYGADGFFVKESLQWEEIESFVKSIEQRG
jgi:YesN/AraC family two-component response regulator